MVAHFRNFLTLVNVCYTEYFFKISNLVHVLAVEMEKHNESTAFYKTERLSRFSDRAAGTYLLFESFVHVSSL